MTVAAGDLSFFYKRINDKIHGLLATHVDDVLAAGTPSFNSDITSKIHRRFDAKPHEHGALTFAGVTIETDEEGCYVMHQKLYAEKLKRLEKGSSFELFRSRRHELAWITHTRPDVQADAAILAQVTSPTFRPEHINQINRAINRVKSYTSLGLKRFVARHHDVGSLFERLANRHIRLASHDDRFAKRFFAEPPQIIR